MSSGGGGLRAAHRGYIYQDLAAAYVLVEALVEQIDRVIVDRKIVEDDRIDDLEVVIASRRVRRQIKWSGNPERCLTEGDFLGVRSSLRIDELVMTRVSAGNLPAEEYRLCATWAPPPAGDPLARYLRKVDAEPTILGSKTQTFCLDAKAVWPVGSAPKWNGLAKEKRLQRDDFVRFCEVFVIELEMPQASLDLTDPGPMETALVEVLVRRVGIGTYPNGGMRAEDVAARAVFLATTARSRGAELTRSDIVANLQLRTDYGHVAQAYPLDRAVMVSRPESREQIVRTALEGGLQIVTAPPGAGKSWELTQIADDLRAHGAIVARHYCYLDPSDDQSALRITSNAFFGNLIYELIRESPELGEKARLGFAADFDALERLLSHAPECGRPLVLMVDGLDHIARVRADVSSVSREQSDIIERLATLDLPPGLAVIVASQPGEHLEPLRAAWTTRVVSCVLPRWSAVDLIALTRAHGVDEALRSLGIMDDEIKATLERLAERAEGNPLYARALSVEIRTGAEVGDIGNPLAWLSSTEDRGGGLSVYYRRLYESVAGDAHVIADVLGVIDFAVTRDDLEDMVGPLVRGRVASAVRALSPVLVDASTQGGLRVFHESFRRFIREQLVVHCSSIADVLAPVLTWLQARDFFADALSFRFLVPALARAGRDVEVWTYIDRAFVRKALAHGHAHDPILANITVAAEVARRNTDWPMLVRCVELHRATLTTFDPSQNTWEIYIEGYLDLFGAEELAERLLFDGRPTLGRNLGLFACTLIDQNGGVPPWREYLALPIEKTDHQGSPYDRGAVLDDSEKLYLNVFRAHLRLRSSRIVLTRFYRRVCEHGTDAKPFLLRRFACTAAEVLGVRETATLVENVVSRKHCVLSYAARCSFLLGVAEAARNAKEFKIAHALAMRAVAWAPDAETFLLCLEQGAVLPETLPQCDGPEGIPIGVGPDTSVFEAEPVRQWVAQVRLQACRSRGDDAVLERERKRISGVGWYRLWLEFVIDTAILEACGSGEDAEVVEAFHRLERDMKPFRGEPRVCDIWAIRYVVEESVNRGLSLLRTRDGWSSVLPILSRVAQETQYTLQGEDGGAIPTATFLRLLLPHVKEEAWGDVVLQALETYVAAHNTTFYPTQAEFVIELARGRRIAGDGEGARSLWSDAVAYLTGYGWHKDSTVYELLESFDVFARVVPESALREVAELQDVVDAIVLHTDGKGTKTALNAWLESLLAIAPSAAGFLIAQANAEQVHAAGWHTAAALRLIASAFVGQADARLLEHLLLTIPIHEYTGRVERDDVEERFSPIRRLASDDLRTATAFFRVAYAVLCDDARGKRDLRALARDFVGAVGVTEMPALFGDGENEEPSRTVFEGGSPDVPPVPSPPLEDVNPPLGTTMADLYRAIRAVARRESYSSPRARIWSDIVRALSDRINEMLLQRRENDVKRLLLFFARDAGIESFSADPHPLAMLADALLEHRRYAAMAYALAYTSTRGSWGEPFGGKKHHSLILHAIELDVDVVRELYLEQLVESMKGNQWPVDLSADILRRLSEWADAPAVEAAWHEMFGVISDRVPGDRIPGRFPRVTDAMLRTDWSLDEVVVALLLARISDPRVHYKIEALRGVVEALRRSPEALSRPLRWWLALQVPRTSLVLVLIALFEAESAPYEVSRAITDDLQALCASSSWFIQRYARALLVRIGIFVPARGEAEEAVGSFPDLGGDWRFVGRAGGWRALRQIENVFAITIEAAERRAYTMLPEVRARQERVELMWGMRREAYPATPVILWETEVLFRALDDALTNLVMNGIDDEALPDPALLEEALLPDLGFHLGRAASRCPRPQWPRPTEVTNGIVDDLTTVGEDDPAYAGWTRIAVIERECPSPADSYTDARPDRDVTVWAAVVAWPYDRDIPEGAWPLILCGELPGQYGPIVAFEREGSWLGDPWRLEPPISLVWTCGLTSSGIGEPLCWRDKDGEVAVAVRTWRVVRGDPEAEPASLEGCDLLVRPDMLVELEKLHGELRELRIAETQSVLPLAK